MPASMAAVAVHMPSPGSASRNGHVLRQWFLEYVANTGDIIEGRSVQDWIQLSAGCTATEYLARMRPTEGQRLRRAQWGGFMEVSLICHACSGNGVVCVMLQLVGDGRYRVVAVAGDLSVGARVRYVYVAWIGAHWLRARMTRRGRQRVEEWQNRE